MATNNPTTVVQLRPTRRPATRKQSRRPVRQLRRQVLAGAAIGTVALTLLALSLSDLAAGIMHVTNAGLAQSWSLAVGLDVGYTACELATVAAASDRMAGMVRRYALPAICATLAVSATFNAAGFAALADGYMAIPAAALGALVTGLVFSLTKIAVALFLGHR